MAKTTSCFAKTCSKLNTFHTISQCECKICLECRFKHKMLIESKTLPPEKSSNCPNCDRLTNKVYVSAQFQNYTEFRPRNSIFDKKHKMHLLKADQHSIEREMKRLDDELKVETVVTEYKHNEKTGSVKFGKTESTAQKIDSAKSEFLKI